MPFLPQHFDFQDLRDAFRDVALNCEYIFKLSVVVLRPEMLVLFYVNELDGDSDFVTSRERPDARLSRRVAEIVKGF